MILHKAAAGRGGLARLDRLKLIELLPGNRVRIRGTRHVEWRPGGPIRRRIENDVRKNFVAMDFANTEEFFSYESVRLTKSSIRQLDGHMRNLVRQMRTLHCAGSKFAQGRGVS